MAARNFSIFGNWRSPEMVEGTERVGTFYVLGSARGEPSSSMILLDPVEPSEPVEAATLEKPPLPPRRKARAR